MSSAPGELAVIDWGFQWHLDEKSVDAGDGVVYDYNRSPFLGSGSSTGTGVHVFLLLVVPNGLPRSISCSVHSMG
jgi:hypothetical protein